jgi:carbonic anhydrase
MKYEDSVCSLEELIDADAFSIERHSLRISQPIAIYDDIRQDTDGVPDGVRLQCLEKGVGSRFGRIDFSKGFSQWWYLSHTDVKTPSEHTQDGKRYDAEIQLHHFYSVTAEEAGINNELATVSIFAQAYDDAVPYPFLDKVICQWRRKEYDVRKECGLDPVESTYPGCFPLKRKKRNLRNEQEQRSISSPTNNSKKDIDFPTAQDVILYNDQRRNNPNHTNVKIHMDEGNWAPAEEKDWDTWIKEQSNEMTSKEDIYHRMRNEYHGGNHTEELHQQFRKLYQYDELEWFNYWPMLGVRTEYYFRYSGSQTIPPCYGNFIGESRVGTNHWRVMKDPIRIHSRQLRELQRLSAERIAPIGSTVNACQSDTAAKVTRDPLDPTKIVDVNNARPLMSWAKPHFKTFCECKDWESKWPEDRNWCAIEDINERFYDKPYNYGW